MGERQGRARRRSGPGQVLSDALAAAELGSLLTGDRLDPAKGFLDPLADALAHSVTPVSRRAAVGGSPEPVLGSSPEDRLFGRKLFINAQASISVPSTEK
jgi:hypothetical protein